MISKRSYYRSALILVLGLVALSQEQFAYATEPTPGLVTVNMPSPVVVGRNLPWSIEAWTAAEALISAQKVAVADALSKLRLNGVTEVEVAFEPQPLSGPAFVDSRVYGTTFLPWRLTGKSAERSFDSKTFPTDKVDMANYLIHLHQSKCSLATFAFWDLSTWFLPSKCSIETPSLDDYLRASLATALKKASLEVGSYELQKLKFALGSGTHPRIAGGNLICPELAANFNGDTQIPLRAADKLGGYEIIANLRNRTAVFKFLGPNLKQIAAGATKDKTENFVRFFDSQVR